MSKKNLLTYTQKNGDEITVIKRIINVDKNNDEITFSFLDRERNVIAVCYNFMKNILLIKKEGKINYTVEHEENKIFDFSIVLNYMSFRKSFTNSIFTQKIDFLEKGREEFAIIVNYSLNNADFTINFNIEGKQ